VNKNQTISIETPEHFELQFQLAGIGTRFLAYLVDRLLQVGLSLFIGILAFSLASSAFGIFEMHEWYRKMVSRFGEWVLAALILAYALITIGYFILFEYFWSGSTPGKRWQGIRVIRKDGRPLSFFDSAIRNILRIIDILADIYPVGLFVMFLDPWTRRLGDLAAGTLVVLETEQDQPVLGSRPLPEESSDPEMRRVVINMTPDEYQLVTRFLARRTGFEPQARERIAWELFARVFRDSLYLRTGRPDPEALLVRAATAYREKTRIL
jgi:uncharacterized RDD family membrane protein YckC